MVNAECLAKPIVERSVIFEFEGADRVRDPLDRIALAVRPIVHRINAPFVTGSMVMRMHDAVQDRIAKIEVG